MKMQALALGVALGFLAAITPSCGMQTCSTANCDGCCQGTMCVKRPDNALNSTCGTSGNACVNCAASNTTCDATTFTCATGPAGGGTAGGGTGGGTAGGGVTCDGCRLQNGTCQPRNTNRQNNNICGSNGDMCRSCVGTPTPVCDNGACIAPPKRVGDQCMQDTECQGSLGPTAECRRTTAAGNFEYPGGYCTVPGCGRQMTDDCPMGSACLNLPRIYGEEQSQCVVTGCGTSGMQGTCRSGYLCLGTGTTFCLPMAMFQQGAMYDTTDKVGQPCRGFQDCSAPTPGAPGAGGACFAETVNFPDGGPRPLRDGGLEYTGFSGGYCTRDCRIDEDCVAVIPPNNQDPDPAEAVCLGVSQTQALCFKGCTEPNLGKSTCRDDYVCDPLFLRDGGLFPTGYCQPSCSLSDGGLNPGVTCPASRDGGPSGCEISTGYCLGEARIIPVRAGQPCVDQTTRCLGGTTCTGLPGGPLTCRRSCMNNMGCAATEQCVPGQFNLSVCEPRPVVDGGTDGGSTTTDAGTTADAGTASDAGAATCPDGGAFVDGGC
ncbi:MAG: hypothetical protein SFW67_07215 [Myxococcaceae bacterium]|nr:hypothetical protein [Myxococcaceae bacterium]